MKKLLVIFFVLFLTAGGFVFSGGQKEAAAEQITLTGLVRNYTVKQDPPWYSAVKTFKIKHPNVEIKLEGLPYNDQRLKVLIAVGAGKGPDIVQVDCIWLGEFASNNIIINISDMLNADPNLKNDYIDVFRKSAQWQGKDYGLWLYTDVRMLSWHKDLFKKAGLDPNAAPKTWAELRATAKKVNWPDQGIYGYAFPAFSTDHTADRWYPFLYMGGGSILSKDYTKAEFNSPAGTAALQLLVNLMDVDKVSPKDLLGIQEKDVSNGFKADKYSMMIKVGEFWKDYRKKGLTMKQYKEKIGVAPLPIPEGGKPATGSGGWIAGITRDSKYPKLAFEFLKTVVATRNMADFVIANGNIPTRKSMLKLENEYLASIPYFNVAKEVLPTTHFRPPIPEYMQISAQIVDAIQKALTEEMTPKASLDKAAVKVNEILAKRKW
ncbi:MAG: ABC transporter substrate-binding protein [Spirochaetes bacterium]|nr:ABC transporter substrate-binding protein [Spirochaetota bacterium]